MKPHLFFLIIFCLGNPSFCQQSQLIPFKSVNNFTYQDLDRTSYLIKNNENVSVSFKRTLKAITAKYGKYSFFYEKVNDKIILIKQNNGEVIGMKLLKNNYMMIGADKRLYRVEFLDKNNLRITDAERNNSNYAYVRNHINLKKGKENLQIETNLNEIPVEVLMGAFIRKHYTPRILANEDDERRNRIILASIAAVIQIFILVLK